MIVGLLRIFYVLLPVSVVAWMLVDHSSFQRAVDYGNSLQGRGGAWIINAEGKETCGTQLEKYLEKKIPSGNENVRGIYRSIGSQTDIAIRYVEDYWFWGSVALVLLFGIFFLLAHRSYK